MSDVIGLFSSFLYLFFLFSFVSLQICMFIHTSVFLSISVFICLHVWAYLYLCVHAHTEQAVCRGFESHLSSSFFFIFSGKRDVQVSCIALL